MRVVVAADRVDHQQERRRLEDLGQLEASASFAVQMMQIDFSRIRVNPDELH
jgi:hypothetical protein